MDMDFIELKQQFLPLCARETAPWENGCVVNGHSTWKSPVWNTDDITKQTHYED